MWEDSLVVGTEPCHALSVMRTPQKGTGGGHTKPVPKARPRCTGSVRACLSEGRCASTNRASLL